LTALERHRLQCAERQLYVVLGMCAGHGLTGRAERLSRAEWARSDAAMWRELWVLMGMCGFGWE
jgi:hypothetical protein